MLISTKFEGGIARQGLLPAYDGTESLRGLSRSFMIITNYVVEGRVRRKDFRQAPFRFDIVAQREGSFDTIFNIVINPETAVIIQNLGIVIGAAAIYELIKLTYRRVTGLDEGDVHPDINQIQEEGQGDIDALSQAVEPSARLAHTVINHGVINININSPDQRRRIVNLDHNTKGYMWENVINEDIRIKLFSVSSFNANTGSGNAFDMELRYNIPFEIAAELDRESITLLLESQRRYTFRRRLGDELVSAVAIQYTSVDSTAGRTKKIRILRVRRNIGDFE